MCDGFLGLGTGNLCANVCFAAYGRCHCAALCIVTDCHVLRNHSIHSIHSYRLCFFSLGEQPSAKGSPPTAAESTHSRFPPSASAMIPGTLVPPTFMYSDAKPEVDNHCDGIRVSDCLDPPSFPHASFQQQLVSFHSLYPPPPHIPRLCQSCSLSLSLIQPSPLVQLLQQGNWQNGTLAIAHSNKGNASHID